ncbi:P-loop containing nucleoside triphosphate hydrolase protein [Schizophyllum amplum]|uniref:P-loop containing nucleoside triphosphate hydrolase protein n=1 Tax=Schizophyllum amplum TaxID=97359 RepID=A0A550CY92_9AGAR|nr:P-loop containing nucleoside triphosphate hydrolase protein [Auriculariopsis ampla]
MKRISPYLWPSKSSSLQAVAGLCIIVLLVGRVVNFGIPFALGELVNIFEGTSSRSPWPILFGYVGLRFLAGSGGLAAVRDALWAPVMQYSDREMSQLAFDHLLNLSFAFHTRRKTGEVLRVLDRGAAINRTLELVLFNFVPIFLDIVIALIVFAMKFEWTLTVVIFFVMFAYGYASIVMTQWRTKLRRRMNDRDIKTRGIHTDCLLNYETVKYFGGEEHEGQRYRKSIDKYQALEYQVISGSPCFSLGLLVGSLIVALRVTRGQSTTGDFIVFITYLSQLYGPLNMLGTTYRAMNQSLVDTEKLLNLLNEPTDVNDKPDAKDLVVESGEIEFKDVNFTYDGRTTALRGVSFKVPKGSSVALVGDSGSGKSTILRLLYRFYDLGPGDGSITIDGQDIRDVTQKSLRSAIGVVPQDTVLFNSSISYNIAYGKFGASMDDIEAAAASAQMHDRILSFPDGYDTKVGERGVRLSGGEKQRIAIARTLLKNPPILLLDEATSALDTSTEKDIQNALQNLMTGRSSLSIAHRLSTIANADVILVLRNGQIVEQGNFKELISLDGIFASMWADQVASSETDHEVTIDIKDIKSKEKEEPGYSVEQQEEPQETAHEEPATVTDVTAAEPAREPIAASHRTAPSESAYDEPAEGASVASAAPELPPKDAETNAPVAFPSADEEAHSHTPEASTADAPAPIAFPGSDDAASQSEAPAAPSTPGVTFDPTVNTTPSRTDTPDPDAEPKRKRISSQNFQRIARRISISTRRGTTGIIPTLKRNESSGTPRGSTDEGSSSVRQETESPAGSVKERKKIKKEKKDKKDSKRQSTI